MLKFSACHEFVPGYYLIALDYDKFDSSYDRNRPVAIVFTHTNVYDDT